MNRRRQRWLNKAFVSFLGIGYIRPASATFGSLGAALVLYWSWPDIAFEVKLLLIVVLFTVGCWICDQVERDEKTHDPHFIVIDEVVGMMITTIFLPHIWWQWLLAFLLFRVFDILKIWPASFFDKKKGGFSIMIDDVIMALPALFVLSLLVRWWS